METYYVPFGWCMSAVAVLFGFGLIPRLAPRFYPTSPGVLVRLAAPLIFGALAAASFLGVGREALVAVVVLGLAQVVVSRARRAARVGGA
jgi:hypothetical protein